MDSGVVLEVHRDHFEYRSEESDASMSGWEDESIRLAIYNIHGDLRNHLKKGDYVCVTGEARDRLAHKGNDRQTVDVSRYVNISNIEAQPTAAVTELNRIYGGLKNFVLKVLEKRNAEPSEELRSIMDHFRGLKGVKRLSEFA
jgi:UDP-N-acetylmuramyl pentapeptide synthase